MVDTAPWPVPHYAKGPQVSPGADQRPAPTLMTPGIEPVIQDRWDLLWQWLVKQHKARPEQMQRLQTLKALLREEREERPSEARTTRIEGIRQECISPFVVFEYEQLWACKSEMGLIFVLDRPEDFHEARAQGPQLKLHPLDACGFGPMDQISETPVYVDVPLPKDQILPWVEAAAVHGYLFNLVP